MDKGFKNEVNTWGGGNRVGLSEYEKLDFCEINF